MARNADWLSAPPVTAALEQLDSHYAVLGCGIGTSRLEGLLDDVARYQTKEAEETLREAFAAVASRKVDARAYANLGRGTWLTFLEPAEGLARLIDRYGVAGERVGRPGAFGRQWARHASDAAWTIWVASGGHGGRGAGILR